MRETLNKALSGMSPSEADSVLFNKYFRVLNGEANNEPVKVSLASSAFIDEEFRDIPWFRDEGSFVNYLEFYGQVYERLLNGLHEEHPTGDTQTRRKRRDRRERWRRNKKWRRREREDERNDDCDACL